MVIKHRLSILLFLQFNCLLYMEFTLSNIPKEICYLDPRCERFILKAIMLC